MEQKKSKERSKLVTVVLSIIFLLFVGMIVAVKVSAYNQAIGYYKIEEPAFSFTDSIAEYTGINKDQVIRITKDGITAYNMKGEEVWLDTLTLDKVVVKQREPYFAVANLRDSKIHIFSDKGKEGEILVEHPILYFSINSNGDVAIIQELKEGHSVNAYNKDGIPINGSRITYIKTAGFPISVEISNDSSMLLASYIDIYSPRVTSIVVGIPLGTQEAAVVDNIKFGIELKDNMIYDLEFITNDIWAAVGEERITYHQLSDGKLLHQLPSTYLLKSPYVESKSPVGYMPIVGKPLDQGKNTFGNQNLWIYNELGEVILEKSFNKQINFYRADEKGVIIGYGNTYEGYDALGQQKFVFHSTYKLETLGYIDRSLVAVTKNEVFKLKRSEQEMKE